MRESDEHVLWPATQADDEIDAALLEAMFPLRVQIAVLRAQLEHADKQAQQSEAETERATSLAQELRASLSSAIDQLAAGQAELAISVRRAEAAETRAQQLAVRIEAAQGALKDPGERKIERRTEGKSSAEANRYHAVVASHSRPLIPGARRKRSLLRWMQ